MFIVEASQQMKPSQDVKSELQEKISKAMTKDREKVLGIDYFHSI